MHVAVDAQRRHIAGSLGVLAHRRRHGRLERELSAGQADRARRPWLTSPLPARQLWVTPRACVQATFAGTPSLKL